MKQILVDMDGVLADSYHQYQQFDLAETGNLISLESAIGKPESEAFPHSDRHTRTKGFFRTARPITGSISGLKYLNDNYKVYIVSSATEFPLSLQEKMEWLNEFYPFISWKQVILCGSKEPIKGDIMIDDHPKNLDTFENRKILFSQPHNMEIENPDYTRADSWQQIMDML